MQLRITTNCRGFAALALTLLIVVSQGCSGPSADMRSEIDALRAEQAQTAAELAEIKALLTQGRGSLATDAATSSTVPVEGSVRTLTVANRPTLGEETARVTFIEYSDYGCPYCAQYSQQVSPRLKRDYVDTGKIRYVFKSYPVDQLHPDAFKAHVAAACAGDQGRYWEMHDRLFANQDDFKTERFVEDASRAGLNTATFRSCLSGAAHDAVIRQDIDEAVRGGVNGTPVFVVALTEPGSGAVTPLRVVVGVQPYEAYADAINAVLATVGAASKQ